MRIRRQARTRPGVSAVMPVRPVRHPRETTCSMFTCSRQAPGSTAFLTVNGDPAPPICGSVHADRADRRARDRCDADCRGGPTLFQQHRAFPGGGLEAEPERDARCDRQVLRRYGPLSRNARRTRHQALPAQTAGRSGHSEQRHVGPDAPARRWCQNRGLRCQKRRIGARARRRHIRRLVMRTRFGHSDRGFTYLGLLFAVVLAGIALALTAQVARTVNQRAREAQLLFAGGQIRDAIRRYYEESPGALRNYPRRFEDLLSDPRFPNTRRHLRRLYPDPMTGRFDWVIERAADCCIAGVHSTSLDRSLMISGFCAGVDFGGAEKYSEWIFVYRAPAGGGDTVPAS